MDADQRRDACREHVSKGENTETCTLSSGSYDSSWSASSHIFLSRKYGCSGVQNQVRSHDAFGFNLRMHQVRLGNESVGKLVCCYG